MELILIASIIGGILLFLAWRYSDDSFEPKEKYSPDNYLHRTISQPVETGNTPVKSEKDLQKAQAFAEIRNTLSIQPPHDVQEAEQALYKQQYIEAARLSREILKHRPRELEALRILCVALLRSGQYEAAQQVANMWIDLAPQNGAAYNVRGVIHSKLDLEDQAFADFKEAARLGSSEDEFVYINLSSRYIAQGNADEALKHINRGLELPANNENRAIQYYQRICIRLMMQEIAGAKDDLASLSQIVVSNIWRYKALIVIHYEERDYAAVIENCNAALKLADPTDTMPYLYRSRACIRLRQWDSAHTDIDRVIGLSHGHHRLSFRITKASYDLIQGLFEEARHQLDAIIAEVPDYVETYNSRAWLLAQMDLLNDSLNDANHAIAHKKPPHPYHFGTRGHTYFLLGQYQEAMADFTKSLELHPYHIFAWLGQALCHYRLGNIAEARSSFHKLIDLDPRYKGIDTLIEDFHPATPFVDAVREMVAAMDVK